MPEIPDISPILIKSDRNLGQIQDQNWRDDNPNVIKSMDQKA
jgi:hypothetical protein